MIIKRIQLIKVARCGKCKSCGEHISEIEDEVRDTVYYHPVCIITIFITPFFAIHQI